MVQQSLLARIMVKVVLFFGLNELAAGLVLCNFDLFEGFLNSAQPSNSNRPEVFFVLIGHLKFYRAG